MTSAAPSVEQVNAQLSAVSVAHELQEDLKPNCEGRPFNLRDYPYLIKPYDSTHPFIVMRKGSQMGMSLLCVFRTILRCKHMYPRGVLYLMPTKDDVSDFSKGRFDRIMQENPRLRALVGDTESANIKKIGHSVIYFRGTRSRSQLKSIPVDAIVYDEYDEMEMNMVALADKRVDGSTFKHRFKISTPTLPDFGIDYDYLRSNQQVWYIRCAACGERTCLELSFPQCLVRRKDGEVVRVCKRCGKEIHPVDGDWVAARKDVEDVEGYWVSQLNSPTVDPRTILDDYENPRTVLSEFWNHRLAMAYADIDDLLDDKTLNAACRDTAREYASGVESILGADIGKDDVHWVIGRKVSESAVDVLDYGRYTGEGDLGRMADKMARFKVELGVIDEMAETRKLREFKDKHAGIFGNYYSAGQRSGYEWDYAARIVKENRTESLDASHRIIVQGFVSFPRPDEQWAEFRDQMKNLARKSIVDEKLGTRTVQWVVRGVKNDHWRHAFNYLCIAASAAPVRKPMGGSSYGPGRKHWKRRGTWMGR